MLWPSAGRVGYRKIRRTQVIDIRFVVETSEEQYYEKVCQCGCVNNCDAPNCRIMYGDNIRALVTYLTSCSASRSRELQNSSQTCPAKG